MIFLENLTHRYGRRVALDRLNLEIPAGELFALLGPNGGGKSTLFRLLSTLVPPQEGTIRVAGHFLPKESARVRPLLGVLFQHPALDRKLRVIENLRCGGHLFGLRGHLLEERIQAVAAATGVQDRLMDFVETLSGGLQRRVEIAKALLPSPQILLLDEPSSGLDPVARAGCWEIYRRLREQGLTVVLTTHLMEEARAADRVGILHEGKLVALGAPDDLCRELGQQVLLVRAADNAAVAAWLEDKAPPREIRSSPGELRILADDPPELARALFQPGAPAIFSATVAVPTLEDVFAHHAGLTLAQADAGPVEDAASPPPAPPAEPVAPAKSVAPTKP